MISLIMQSRASLTIVPMQDYLGYDNRARMNQPSTVGTNWRWRMKSEDLTDELLEKIGDMTILYERCK